MRATLIAVAATTIGWLTAGQSPAPEPTPSPRAPGAPATASTTTVRGSKPLRRVIELARRGDPGRRIVGGRPTTIAAHPWQVALVASSVTDNGLAQFCGGSMIAPRWVVTAAHCLDEGTTHTDVEVLTGSTTLVGGTRVRASEIKVHPDWNPASRDSDIALLRVAADLGGTAIVAMSPGEEAAHLRDGEKVTVTGWGALAFGSLAVTNTLQEVDVPFVSRTTCNGPISYGGRVTDNMFCAGYRAGKKDTCQGDSGGPATTFSGGARRLAGITSWGDGCGDPHKYGIYTRVSRFETWVRNETATAGAR